MIVDSIDIEILKQHLDRDTLIKVATLDAEKKAEKFKYVLNIIRSKKYPHMAHGQLKGTVSNFNNVKIWVNHSLGRIVDPTTVDKSAICSKYSSLMKAKAKDAILKELLK